MSEVIVNASKLQKNYKAKTAINTLSFDISQNSITGLIGRNGSGKTTLMKIISGQLDYTSGFIEVFGEKPMDSIHVLQNAVYIYHNFAYKKDLNLHTILLNYNTLFPNFDLEFAYKLITYFELKGKLKYNALSQGMSSIFNFICAISCRTKLTLLDEPVLGMDVTVRRAAYDILLRDYSEHPRTFVISSHLLNELETVLSDILLIDKGSKVLHKNLDDIRNSVYRIDGNWTKISIFAENKEVIEKQNSPMQSYIIIHEPLTEKVELAAKEGGFSVSAIRVEDLCVYLTKQDKEEEFKCLW